MRVGAGLGERVDLALGPLDHQVHVEHRTGAVDALAQRRDDDRPHRDRRDEVAVHDVDVDDPRAGVEHLLHLRAEAREVGGEDRRRDARPRDASLRSRSACCRRSVAA